MLKFQVAPKFLLVEKISNIRPKSGNIEIITQEENPCAMGRVVQNASEKYPDLKAGDVVYFQSPNCQPVRLQADLIMHGLVWEDSLLGWVKAEDSEAILASVQGPTSSKLIAPHTGRQILQ